MFQSIRRLEVDGRALNVRHHNFHFFSISLFVRSINDTLRGHELAFTQLCAPGGHHGRYRHRLAGLWLHPWIWLAHRLDSSKADMASVQEERR